MVLFASDLDNTLVYSHKAMPPEGAVPVDYYNGEVCCRMTKEAHFLLQQLALDVLFVPVTTRSAAQYCRMSFIEPAPRYALVANGGILLQDGALVEEWHNKSLALIEAALPHLRHARRLLEQDSWTVRQPELVDGLFLFAKSESPEQAVNALRKQLPKAEVTVFHQNQKLYVVPNPLHKGAALQRLRQLLKPDAVVAAGDSSMDYSMLLSADQAFLPEDYPVGDYLPPHFQFLPGERNRFADRLLSAVEQFAADFKAEALL